MKNHSFHDGNKRIAATLFLYFLNMNNALLQNGDKRISDSALVAVTIMIAESKPKEKGSHGCACDEFLGNGFIKMMSEGRTYQHFCLLAVALLFAEPPNSFQQHSHIKRLY